MFAVRTNKLFSLFTAHSATGGWNSSWVSELSTAYYLLSFIYCLLCTVYYLLSTVNCQLSTFDNRGLKLVMGEQTVYCLLSAVFCLLSTVYYLLSAEYCLISTDNENCLLSTVNCLHSATGGWNSPWVSALADSGIQAYVLLIQILTYPELYNSANLKDKNIFTI